MSRGLDRPANARTGRVSPTHASHDVERATVHVPGEWALRFMPHFTLDAAVFPNAMSHFFTVSIESGGTRSSIEIRLFPDRNER